MTIIATRHVDSLFASTRVFLQLCRPLRGLMVLIQSQPGVPLRCSLHPRLYANACSGVCREKPRSGEIFIVTRDRYHIPSSVRSETAVLSPINGLRLGGPTLIYKHFVPPGLFPDRLLRRLINHFAELIGSIRCEITSRKLSGCARSL